MEYLNQYIDFFNNYSFYNDYIGQSIVFAAFLLSLRCPNTRFLLGFILVVDFLYLLLRQKVNLPALGGWYYVIVLCGDILIAYGIISRLRLASWLSSILPQWAAERLEASVKQYQLTRQEIILVLLYSASALLSCITLIERLVRKSTGLDILLMGTSINSFF
ncbi:hypothetical protein [Marinibactrum halimedae]|uniref:Uncharacterized protein n=1 Tax=Marinibactrum halimedae TaxID=1444977 RepID=A0AA37T3F6_9GAMM|nr:hypothetical protein [Marinibactrum halimedae]MCD9459700.1 hypothetical protein [Marinibactrum halimedae]GLS24542.1 hypothetical protein GCM10007877_02540 [Marinibactrum halimedae]